MSHTWPTFDYHEGIRRNIPVQRAHVTPAHDEWPTLESNGDECLIS